MNANLLFIPVFIQILLTFVLLNRMAYFRLTAIRKGHVKIKDIALGQKAWPESATKAENSFHNQFQMPILFYVAIVMAHIYQLDSNTFLILAFIFPISRILHALVHSTTNNVKYRFLFFVIGVWTLLAMWILMALYRFGILA